MPQQEYTFTVKETDLRLDKYVAAQLPDFSRAQAQKLLTAGYVTLNGQPGKASAKLNRDDVVRVTLPPPSFGNLPPLAIPVPVLYEDDDVLVVDKPAGLTVHPAPGYSGPTLVNAVVAHLSRFDAAAARPGIVHRLDKNTSGVMVVARHPAALAKVAEQFKKHTVKKVYIALVRGKLSPATGVIEAPIGRDSGDRTKMAVSPESRGRHARTVYRVVQYLPKHTLLEAMPETGRTHQIRVHLAAIGHPVFGDAVYGQKSPVLPRQFLHAHQLGFYLPSNGQWREFESPLPADLAQTMKQLA